MSDKTTDSEKKVKKPSFRVIIVASVIILISIISGICFYWGVASYYKEIRTNNLNRGISFIEKGEFSHAVSFLRRAHDQGDLDALAYLTWIECSRGNYAVALDYARLATKLQIPSAFEVMGDLSILGYGQAIGVDAAISFFEQGAALYGDDGPKELRGMIDRALPLAENITDYRKLVIKAMHFDDPKAFLRVGDMLFLGDGVGVNPSSAINNWQKAQVLGLNEANTRLAGAYFYGYGVNQDIKKAVDCYSKAATGGDAIAYYSLGLITLRNDNKNPENIKEASELFKRAMLLNYAPAASALALLEGGDLDKLNQIQLQSVVQWFKLAYTNHDETGSLFYALMLASGIGVEKDYDRALSIIYDGVKLGSIASSDILKTLSQGKDPKVLLKQAYSLSYNVLLGEISFFEGAPEASSIYHDDKEHGYELIYNLKDNVIAAKVGSNFPKIIKDISSYDVKGQLLITPMLARVFVQAMPSTGARVFSFDPVKPKPKTPITPLSYENGRDIEVPYNIQ